MSNWHSFPDRSWTPIGELLSGFNAGEGAYGTSYALCLKSAAILNGRVSASIRVAKSHAVTGAGVVARANNLRSFVAFFVVTDHETPKLYSVRLAAFKEGRLVSLVSIKKPISISDAKFHIALQFFSGEMVGQVTTDTETHTLKHILPEVPFPGYCGVIRFYDSNAIAQKIQIEEIAMKSILQEEATEERIQLYTVFLTHTSEDKDDVLRVIESLEKAGISYWVDHEQIKFGDGIVAKIEEGLQNSRFVVVCLSENLKESSWCRAEYGPILYREFSGDTSRRVIPLSLDGSKDSSGVPLLLSDKMRADFTDPDSLSSFISFLKESGSTQTLKK